jgi:hypothetical protein
MTQHGTLGLRFSILTDGRLAGAFEANDRPEETPVVEYRHGNSPIFYPIKMPGLGKVGNVVFRQGGWHEPVEADAPRRTLIITATDASGEVCRIWTLVNAWPTKITATGPSVELLEISFEAIREE